MNDLDHWRSLACHTPLGILSDLDDSIGGQFQTNLWSQLQLLWVSPGQLDAVLASIQSKMPAS